MKSTTSNGKDGFFSDCSRLIFPRYGTYALLAFKLHPTHEFRPVELFVKPHGRCCAIRKPEDEDYPPLGIVDVCPCIKLTTRGRIKLEKSLQMFPSLTGESNKEPLESNGPVTGLCRPRNGEFWWHEYRKTYGSAELTTKVKPLLGPRGNLLLITRYEYQKPQKSTSQSPRLFCPHHYLDRWADEVLRCRKTHACETSRCFRCIDLHDCWYCETHVYDLVVDHQLEGEKISCSVCTERKLESGKWNTQAIVPYALHNPPELEDEIWSFLNLF